MGRVNDTDATVPLSIEARVLAGLAELNEEEFTRRVVIPMLRGMYPNARIEYTNGPLEAGRDVVVIAQHGALSRQWIVCAQVKAHRISPGASRG